MPLTTEELNQIKGEIGQIREFYEGKLADGIEPLEAENQVLRNSVAELEGRFRSLEAQRSAALPKPVVQSGKYRGMDVVDLAITRAFGRVAGEEGRPAPWLAAVEEALSSTGAGTGAELTGETTLGMLWEDVNLRTMVAPLFRRVNMPTNPMKYPTQLGRLQFYPGSQNTATIATDVATGERLLTAYELVAEVDWSYDLDEDSVVAMVPTVREDAVESLAETQDDVLVNADALLPANQNINNRGTAITATLAGYAHFALGFYGLRAFPLLTLASARTNINGALTDANLRSVRALMGKYGVQPSQVAIIVGPETYFSMMGLSSVLTLDKFGPQATVLTGQLGSIDGMPIIVSEFMRLANASGIVEDGATENTKGALLAVNRTQWAVGYRREPMVEVWRDVQKRQVVLVVSMRIAMRSRSDADVHTALGYNITV